MSWKRTEYVFNLLLYVQVFRAYVVDLTLALTLSGGFYTQRDSGRAHIFGENVPINENVPTLQNGPSKHTYIKS